MFDVDHFKSFNDTYGHAEGDNVLRRVAAHLSETAGGAVYRYGGEEFAVLLPGVAGDEAAELAETVRTAIGELKVELDGRAVREGVLDLGRDLRRRRVAGLELRDDEEVAAEAVESDTAAMLAEKCIRGIEADEARCRRNFEASAGLATLLNPAIGYDRVAALVGGSFGGMQALEWAVMYPRRVRSIIAIATCMQATAQQIAWGAIGRRAIRLDPRWRGGDYYDAEPGDGPSEGLAIARMVAQVTFRSDNVFTDRFGRDGLTSLSSSGSRPRLRRSASPAGPCASAQLR